PSVWRGRLAAEGWSGAPGAKARRLLALFLTSYRTQKRALCVPRTGWHGGAFVFPDNMVLYPGGADHAEEGKERLVLQVQTPHNPFQSAGTLEGWQHTVAAWARGNSRLMLAIGAALAAPLLDLCNMESGGFNFTSNSTIGKTTALIAAASVWGRGSASGGYVQNWRATSNGLEGLAALHSDALLALDEIDQAPARTVQEAAYMLANGMGKSRACQDGSIRAAQSWRLIVLSTGENGLADKIAEEGGRPMAGQQVRLIDVPGDAGAGLGLFEDLHGFPDSLRFADAIRAAAATDYGHAATAFLAELQKRRADVLPSLRAYAGDVSRLCPADAGNQVKRGAKRFLLCAAAAEMAAEWGLLPWAEGEALAAVRKCFAAWLEIRGGVGAAEDADILKQVQLFLEQHGQDRFQNLEAPADKCINRVGFRAAGADENGTPGTFFFILPESFRAEVCKGHSAKRAAALLYAKGLLLRGDSNSFTRKPPTLPGMGRPRCYTLFLPDDDGGEAGEKEN
ncbi:MAG: DUF927 domain-containing protein, partial [Desulfovibrionaceae bacterium]|nr:DUF927 domain-containing protein [Desulfovibrionaceae bacterium]